MSSKAAQYQYETKEQHVHDRKTHLCYDIPSLLGDQNKGKNETISKKGYTSQLTHPNLLESAVSVVRERERGEVITSLRTDDPACFR
jgi:hypothetical protein